MGRLPVSTNTPVPFAHVQGKLAALSELAIALLTHERAFPCMREGVFYEVLFEFEAGRADFANKWSPNLMAQLVASQ